MQFFGTGKRLSPADYREIADSFGLTEVHLRTVVAVETDGSGFDKQKRPDILFERHRFYRELKNTPDKQRRAVKMGIAYPSWGEKPYPRSADGVWAEFEKAAALDLDAAIRSTSWGLGQIMGDEFDEAGYTSPQAMVESFCESEYNQLVGMCKLIVHRRLDNVLKRFPDINACRAFAKTYNGAGYAKNNYHNKLQQAYIMWDKRVQKGMPMEEDGTLRMGSKGTRVKALQEKLNELGYHCRADGVFGSRTRDMVLAWQADNSAKLDGTMDAQDMVLLDKSEPRYVSDERAEATEKEVAKDSSIMQDAELAKKVVVGSGAVLGGAKAADEGGLLDKASDAANKVDQASSVWTTLKSAIQSVGLDEPIKFISDHPIVVVAVVGVVLYFVIKRIKKSRLRMHQEGEAI